MDFLIDLMDDDYTVYELDTRYVLTKGSDTTH